MNVPAIHRKPLVGYRLLVAVQRLEGSPPSGNARESSRHARKAANSASTNRSSWPKAVSNVRSASTGEPRLAPALRGHPADEAETRVAVPAERLELQGCLVYGIQRSRTGPAVRPGRNDAAVRAESLPAPRARRPCPRRRTRVRASVGGGRPAGTRRELVQSASSSAARTVRQRTPRGDCAAGTDRKTLRRVGSVDSRPAEPLDGSVRSTTIPNPLVYAPPFALSLGASDGNNSVRRSLIARHTKKIAG